FYGPTFGETVHKAIAHVVLGQAPDAPAAVGMAVTLTGLDRNVEHAVEDVLRAHRALSDAGLLPDPGTTVRLEYPVALAEGGKILGGYIDFLALRADTLHLLDFKTDPPPAGDPGATYPAYVDQVRTYARILAAVPALAGLTPRLGLLFTGDGRIREVAP
ncbi:MAG: DNA helicase UvrD, partial [Deltaproteobacteria bacterium]|nr:DNA helicase UvrD [Deltaproteobacteria bacterium]